MNNQLKQPGAWASIRANGLTLSGLTFVVAAFVALVALVWQLINLKGTRGFDFGPYESPEVESDYVSERMFAEMVDHYLSVFLAPLLMFVAIAIASVIGFALLRAGGTASRQVIPAQDRELLSKILEKSPDKAIDWYVRLSSLTGVTGTFTKVGLTGLPLATIMLTIAFTLLAILARADDGSLNPAFFDLAKLTLGAFLGSYVQRQRSTPPEQLVGGESSPT